MSTKNQDLHMAHYACDDCWYSCPKAVHEDGESAWCGPEEEAGKCFCAADRVNSSIDALVAERDRLAQVVEASVTQLAAERDHFKAERDRLREALINNDEMIEGLVAERDRLVLAAQGVVRADGLADIGEPGADMAWDAALSELARLLPQKDADG